MSYKLLYASSLEEAKKLNPSSEEFVMIGNCFPKITKAWKHSEGSSIPGELKLLCDQDGIILVKITERKTKFFQLAKQQALCCESFYHQALKLLE